MLHAVQTDRDRSCIKVPESLDDIDGLLALRAAVEERITNGCLLLELDCTRLRSVSHPALGWLTETASRLAVHSGTLVLNHVGPGICLQLRSLGPDLPGLELRRAPVRRH